MSPSESTVTYEPVWLRHRQNCVEAIRYDGTEHCRRAIVAWVTTRGGEAYEGPGGTLWLVTPQRTHPMANGQWVIRGVAGEFYNPENDHVALNYDRVPGPDHSAVLDRDQAAALVVAADHISDMCRGLTNLETREMVGSLVDIVHQLAAHGEALR